MERVELAELMFKIMPTMNRKFFRQLPHLDHSHQTMRLLHTVMHHNNEPMKFFGDKLFISKPNLSKLVDSMIEDGLLAREQDKNDRRVIRISITEKGKETVMEHFEKMKVEVAKLFTIYDASEIDELGYHFSEIMRLFEKND